MACQIISASVFLLGLISSAAAEGLLSLDSSGGFNGLRSCARGCYNGGIRDGYLVASYLDCKKPGLVYVPPDNDCFCRPDLQESAVRYLSACVYTSCSQNQLDVSSATQVYKDYCASAGYTASPKSVAAQATGSTMQGTATGSSNPGLVVVNTGAPDADQPAADPNSNQTGDGSTSGLLGLGIGPIVGIVAAVISAIAAVMGFIIKYRHYKK